MKKGVKPVYNVLMSVICLTFLVSAATWLVLGCTPIYYLLVKVLHVPEMTGYSFDICKTNYDVLIEYNMFWGAEKLVFPDFVMSMTGEIHFAEVKDIFVAMQFAAIGAGILTVVGYLVAKKTETFGWLKGTIFLTGGIIAVLGSWIAIDWEGFFVFGHSILFKNDYWLFDPEEDPIINILPDEVFLTDAALIIVLIIVGLIACGILYRRHTGKGKNAGKKKSISKQG